MQEYVEVTGIILKTVPIGEYDRRIVILTQERGKIAAFVKGARRQNSKFMALSLPFLFGTFQLYEGKSSYNVMDIHIKEHYSTLKEDYIKAYYGMYFLEIADYYGRENNDDKELLKLLYVALKALTNSQFDARLVRAVYECKAIVVNGEFPGIPNEKKYLDSTVYTIHFIVQTPCEKLFSFLVKDEILIELIQISKQYCTKIMDKKFKSLEIIESLG